MEIPQTTVIQEEEPIEDSDHPQFMEEEMENIDIGDLDITGLETACTTNNFDNIPAGQLRNLEEVLSRAQRKKDFGIQTRGRWDGRLMAKELKKSGRKTNLQRTITVGQILVDSERYSKLTKYFHTEKNPSQ